MWKISYHSFCIVESLHHNFCNVEKSNCTYYIAENTTRCLTTLWKLSVFLPQNYLNFLTETIHIVNYLEHFFHISSIVPTDLFGLPQILPQSAKFLPLACLRCSRNTPSLFSEGKQLSLGPQQHLTLSLGEGKVKFCFKV